MARALECDTALGLTLPGTEKITSMGVEGFQRNGDGGEARRELLGVAKGGKFSYVVGGLGDRCPSLRHRVPPSPSHEGRAAQG